MEGFNVNVFDPKIPYGLDFYGFPNKKRWKLDMDLFPNGLSNVPTYTPIFGVPLELGYMEHAVALDFRNRVINDGGVLRDNEYFAMNYRCWAREICSIDTIEIAYYPYVGGFSNAQSIANFKHNLISSSFKLNDLNISAAMCTRLGYQGNGTSAAWRTAAFGSTHFSNNNTHLSFYCRSTSSAGSFWDMGYQNGAGGGEGFFLIGFGGSIFLDMYNSSDRIQITGTPSIQGLMLGNRIGNNNMYVSRNGQIIRSNNSGRVGSGLVGAEITLGCRSVFPGGTFDRYSNRQYSFFSFGSAYNSSQQTINYIIEQNVQSFLERAVNP